MNFAEIIPVKQILKVLISKISDLVAAVRPDEVTPEQQEQLERIVGTFYAILKYWGPLGVASTETDLDDAALAEAIQICEQLADAYDLELNLQEV